MRNVYTPPRISTGWFWPCLGAALITLGAFLVLPLTQMISSGAQKKMTLTKVDVATPPPPPAIPDPPPPQKEERKDEPPPQLDDQPKQFNFDPFNLDLSVGTGGALGSVMSVLEGAGDALDQMSIFDISDLDKPPVLVASVSPVYPRELRKAKVEGSVVIIFVLDENGRVENPRIESSSRPEFEPTALEAVRRWKFNPGMKEGEPVRTHMRLPMRFRINS